MKKILIFICYIIFATHVYAYENTYAVIIGVADYKNDEYINDLPYTINNTRAMYSFLRSKAGGNVPAKNICYLTDANATRANIIHMAKALFSKAKEGDRVIFYYGGHGGEGFVTPYDYNGFVETTIYYSDIKAIFKTARCKTKLLFMDSCYSGAIKKNPISRNGNMNNIRRNDDRNMNIAVMSACKANEFSWQTSSYEMGVFTHFLIKGLSGAANSDGNKYITIKELFHYVYKHVIAETKYYESLQTPELFGNFDLRLIVANVNN